MFVPPLQRQDRGEFHQGKYCRGWVLQHFREWGWTGAPSNLPPTATDPGVADKAGADPAKQKETTLLERAYQLSN